MKILDLTLTTVCVISALVLLAQSQPGPDCPFDPSTVANPFRLPDAVTVQRVMRCLNSEWCLPCNSVVDDSDFLMLNSALNKRRAKRLYISQVNDPGNAKNVALFIAGQRFGDGSDGASGGLTGQRQGYRMAPDGTRGRNFVELRSNSYAKQLLNLGYFSQDDTFVGLVFDARFHHEYGPGTKLKILDAYVRYIESKLGSDVETIYLAGHSRGGCLSLRLAQNLVVRYPQARVIVQTFDPVCSDNRGFGGGEMGIDYQFGFTDNPLVDINTFFQSWRVQNSDFNLQYPSSTRTCLSILNSLSGDPVPGTFNTIRAFGHVEFNDDTSGIGTLLHDGRPWYEQEWSTRDHVGIVYDPVVWRNALNHFKAAMRDMPCPCGGVPPPSTPRPVSSPLSYVPNQSPFSSSPHIY